MWGCDWGLDFFSEGCDGIEKSRDTHQSSAKHTTFSINSRHSIIPTAKMRPLTDEEMKTVLDKVHLFQRLSLCLSTPPDPTPTEQQNNNPNRTNTEQTQNKQPG